MFKILCILFLLFTTPGMAAEPFADRFAGNWHGVGVQSNGADWSIALGLSTLRTSIDYPSIPCGGIWELRKSEPDRVLAVEHLEYGSDICINGGTVVLQQYGADQLLYQWFERNGSISAVGVLFRDNADKQTYNEQRDATLEAIDKGFDDDPEAGKFVEQWLGM